MNRWIRRALTTAALAGGVWLLGSTSAYAHDTHSHHAHPQTVPTGNAVAAPSGHRASINLHLGLTGLLRAAPSSHRGAAVPSGRRPVPAARTAVTLPTTATAPATMSRGGSAAVRVRLGATATRATATRATATRGTAQPPRTTTVVAGAVLVARAAGAGAAAGAVVRTAGADPRTASGGAATGGAGPDTGSTPSGVGAALAACVDVAVGGESAGCGPVAAATPGGAGAGYGNGNAEGDGNAGAGAGSGTSTAGDTGSATGGTGGDGTLLAAGVHASGAGTPAYPATDRVDATLAATGTDSPWLWRGVLLMVVGGALLLTGRRGYRAAVSAG